MARKRRQLVLLGTTDALEGGSSPLGSPRSLRQILAAYNTAADDSGPDEAGMERLHGPGFTLDAMLHSDPVPQAMITMNEETYAWPVIERLCKATGWRLMDAETGRVMGW